MNSTFELEPTLTRRIGEAFPYQRGAGLAIFAVDSVHSPEM